MEYKQFVSFRVAPAQSAEIEWREKKKLELKLEKFDQLIDIDTTSWLTSSSRNSSILSAELIDETTSYKTNDN